MAGRDQRVPMERVVRLAAALQHHAERGVPGDVLARIAGFSGADPGTRLGRELKHLESQGWHIENIAPKGESALYRLTTVDNRLRVRLTPAQQTALRRAVLMADRGDLVQRLGLPDDVRPAEVSAPTEAVTAAGLDPDLLGRVVDAVREHRTLAFVYKGTERLVHPESVRNQNGTWYLRGVEQDDAGALATDPTGEPLVKTFVVSRMGEPESGRPGSSQRVHVARHAGLHPMTWEVDPPVEVELEAAEEFVPDVERWLGVPLGRTPLPQGGVRLRYLVTHRAALRARLNELGRRVRVIGPPQVRAEVLAALAASAGLPVPPVLGAPDAATDQEETS